MAYQYVRSRLSSLDSFYILWCKKVSANQVSRRQHVISAHTAGTSTIVIPSFRVYWATIGKKLSSKKWFQKADHIKRLFSWSYRWPCFFPIVGPETDQDNATPTITLTKTGTLTRKTTITSCNCNHHPRHKMLLQNNISFRTVFPTGANCHFENDPPENMFGIERRANQFWKLP